MHQTEFNLFFLPISLSLSFSLLASHKTVIEPTQSFQQTHLYSLVPASNACTRKLGCLNSSSSRSYLDVRHVGIKKRFFFGWV
ncbi:hypothetical protein GGI35DRAFT_102452 [Trichoderma velutinum]